MLLSPCVTQISINLPFDQSASDALLASDLKLPERLKVAHPKRQEKYLAGRLCAYQAFLKLGLTPPKDIPMAPDGSPVWPSGWTGSITHSEGFASAAIGKITDVLGIGIDSEPFMSSRTYSSVAERIMNGKEITDLCPVGWSEVEWATLVFSAKESIYKCLRPICGNFFSFEDAEMYEIDLKLGVFKFYLKRDIGGPFKSGWKGQGRFEKTSMWLHTAMELLP